MAHVREKFATQVDKDLLAEIRKIAKDEGRQLQSVIEDALRAHVEERSKAKPRRHVMDAYRSSLPRYGGLYEKLAK
ncbi:hypothetical protein [Methylocystis sp.]|uniref:hypothetical protein n=1 Tax=Methylocystis sp. TaxID=1911079 RepID=UPI00273667F0|nr:hypothetical protein [Methylocystis sp.]MDP3553025.1 hypothetical protein [Methylocystis sp.]